jgi:hypothetical protein
MVEVSLEQAFEFQVEGPLQCTACKLPLESDLQQLAAEERKATEKLKLMESTVNLRREENLLALLVDIGMRLHPMHWLAHELHDLLADFYAQKQDWSKSAQHLASKVQYIAALNAGPLPQFAWAHEALADKLSHFSGEALRWAQHSYETALVVLCVLYPEEHQYICDVKSRMQALGLKAATPACNATGCSVQKKEGQAFKRCSQCRCAVYCSDSCQKAHWHQQHKDDCKVLKAVLQQFSP